MFGGPDVSWTRRFVSGHYVPGHFVAGRFVGVPYKSYAQAYAKYGDAMRKHPLIMSLLSTTTLSICIGMFNLKVVSDEKEGR